MHTPKSVLLIALGIMGGILVFEGMRLLIAAFYNNFMLVFPSPNSWITAHPSRGITSSICPKSKNGHP